MKRKLAGICIILWLPFQLVAQSDSAFPKVSVFASAGSGVPVGSFLNERYASSGFSGSLSAYINIKKTIYNVVCMATCNSNNYNLNNYLNDPNTHGLADGGGIAVSNGSYCEYSVLAGLAMPFPRHSNSIYMSIQFLSGLTYNMFPYENYYEYNYYPTSVTYTQIHSAMGVSVPLDVGFSVTARLYHHLLLRLGADYYASLGSWSATEQLTTGSTVTTQSYQATIPVRLLNLSAGLGYSFY